MGGRLLRRRSTSRCWTWRRSAMRHDALRILLSGSASGWNCASICAGWAAWAMGEPMVQGVALPRDLLGMREALRPGRSVKLAARKTGGPAGWPRRGCCRMREAGRAELAGAGDRRRTPATLSTPGVIRDGFSAGIRRPGRQEERRAKDWIANLQVTERSGSTQEPQGRLQQGLRLLHRDHEHAQRQGPRSLHPQADAGECGALHHFGA